MSCTDDLFGAASQQRGNTLLSESPYPMLFPSFSCMPEAAEDKVLLFCHDWQEVNDLHMNSAELKACLELIDEERLTAEDDVKKKIDWWRPIYESNLSDALAKEENAAKMALYNSPEAVAERAAATKLWFERQQKTPAEIEYKKRNELLRDMWSRGFTGTHEDLFGPWKDE